LKENRGKGEIFSSFSKRFGSCTILFPSSVGIFASIKNLILQERDVHVFIDIATARTILLRWLEKDTVFYPSPTPKRQGKYRVLTIDGKCECGSDQGFSKEEWHF
jgi:hypothetical protein